tara:strand:+ start:656 stop:925 length:270 start_codon:yes stop_codon:yes gene_type:complete
MGLCSSKPRNIYEILFRQTNEMLAVTTQEEFNAMLDKHKKELPLLLPDEERRFKSSINSYGEAVKKKRKELEKKFGSTIKGNEVPQLKL